MDMKYQPVVVIGAPRSGTNMLRDVLCQLDGFATWSCDEINYIWRHGNISNEYDEFGIGEATQKNIKYIRKQFDKQAKKTKVKFLVEKTCANSLRVRFVNKIIPEAKYIFIVRDGIDASGSALIRWKAKLDFSYIFKKVKFVPVLDLPYYAISYLGNRVHRLFSAEKRLAFWGPKYKGINQDLKKHSLVEVCALQWQKCVNLAQVQLEELSSDKVIFVKYEDFVTNPAGELNTILTKLNYSFSEGDIAQAIRNVSDKSIGKGRKALDDFQLKSLKKLLSPTLEKFKYETN